VFFRLGGNDLDEEDVETICLRLYDLSLVRSIALTRRHIKLHDVIRAYLHTKTQQTLSLFQQEFLRTHNLMHWADLPLSDAYLWQYLILHLIQANQPDLLLETVTDLRSLAKKIYIQHSAFAAEADIEYVMNNVANRTLLADLKEQLTKFGDLLYLCETLEEVECQLLVLASQLRDFSAQYQRFQQEMTHPYLLPWYPLPTKKVSNLIRTLRGHTEPVL
jgi:hypothetical protein